MIDRERWNLRGPVFSCRIERTWYYRKCGAEACEMEERKDSTTLEFSPDGAPSAISTRRQHSRCYTEINGPTLHTLRALR